MPKKNGNEVCREFKEDPETAHIKIVMLAALPRGEYWEQAMAAGADGYFTKPFSPTLLLKKVEGGQFQLKMIDFHCCTMCHQICRKQQSYNECRQ